MNRFRDVLAEAVLAIVMVFLALAIAGGIAVIVCRIALGPLP